jgi:hypothetical protein
VHGQELKHLYLSLVKKLIFSALKKWQYTAEVGTFQRYRSCTHIFLLGIDAFSAEKFGATQRSAEKNGETRHKLALFSATVVFSLGLPWLLQKPVAFFHLKSLFLMTFT